MYKLNRKKLSYSCTSIVLIFIFSIMLVGLYTYSDVVNLSALLWFLMLFVAIIVLTVAALFAYDAWNYGKKKKDVRWG